MARIGALAIVLAAFVGGYRVGSVESQSGIGATQPSLQTAVPSDPAARATALEFLEQAYAARFEQRPKEALALVRRARETDPMVPGADLVAAEIAFGTRQFADLREYALRAVRLHQYTSQANALLGLGKWITRNVDSPGAAASFGDASDLLSLASDQNYFSSAPRFFFGDVLRQSGQHEKGSRRALEALHRLNPWDSSLLVSLKSALAAQEAGLPPETADSVGCTPAARDAVLQIRGAFDQGESEDGQKTIPWRTFLTLRQADFLLSDPALSESGGEFPQNPSP